jgi:hypothetical protein
VLRIGPRFRLFAHAHVLVHKEGHDHTGLFKGPFRILNYMNQWWLGPFYGQVPMSYEAGKQGGLDGRLGGIAVSCPC